MYCIVEYVTALPRPISDATALGASAEVGSRRESDPQTRLAEKIALRIETSILRSGWPVGTSLGSEADLLSHHGVSRAVLREAVRLLEHHQMARMRRGPGGGLFVTAPDASSVTWAIALHLQYRRVTIAQMQEMRRAIEVRMVELAAENISEPGVARLRAWIDEEGVKVKAGIPSSHHAFHQLLAEFSDNPAFVLFVASLTALIEVRAPTRAGPELVRQAYHAHVRIAEAVIAGDAALARHRMVRHLDALFAFVKEQTPG